jgi:diguanylate cyclase (GGDEF)-like protein
MIITFSFEIMLFPIATSERIKRMNQSRITAEKEAARDVLCDLYNRRGWSAKAQTMLECQRATGGFLCLLYLDIDNFKQINDGYGHQTGDEILLALTKILHNQVRDKDVLGRIGGDEFVVLGHFFQKKQCDSMIYRIRGKLAKLKIRTSVGDVMTSASVGAVIFLEPEQSISHMLYQGDSAMYQQKQRRPSRASEASG